ncbi:glycosyltransferase family 39 protein [Kitasatospora azatica]|uniref:glycosyltransferase family 39 protein n=1 Tax=Kitasatospora azatica TaxID=58347 RepID=UPI0005630D20|nr:glycosyltransferase family 39 protein [Kitasatospora azatica]
MSTASELPEQSAGDGEAGGGGVGRNIFDLARRGYWLWPALLTLGFGVYGSARVGLWRDELATWSAINRSPGQLYYLLHHVDAVSGAYYLFLQEWVRLFGHSLTVLRLPSALAMAGAAAFVALTGGKLFNKRTGLTAGLLFAVIPSVSRYAQEARSYAIVVLAVAAATWLLLRALERSGTLRWLLYSLAVATVGVFHMVALAILAPHALIVVARWWRERDRRLLLGFPAAALVALLAVLPIAYEGHKQAGRQLGWTSAPDLKYVADPFWRGLYGSTWVSLCVLALAVLPLAWPRGRRPAVTIAAVAILPIALIWVVSQSSSHYFLDRYLLFTLSAWAVLAGAGLCALRPRALVAVGLVAVALVGLDDQRHLRQVGSREQFNAKAAAAVIAKDYQPGDGLIAVRGDKAYLQIETAVDYDLPADRTPRTVLVSKTAAAYGDLLPLPCADPTACVGDTPRLWVVTIGNWLDPFTGLSSGELAALQNYKQVSSTNVPGLMVTLVERK